MIDLEHVSKEYKRGGPLALDDISLHVDDGEFVFLLGHSGAGKSTLLKLLLREELPSEGKVTVLGKDVARLRRHQVPYLRRQMGIIFQDFRLIPTMTVYENIAFAMHVTNVKSKEIRDRVEYMLELVHLEDKAKAYPDTLSGGEQQRVAVARALAHGPKLVIADEPTGNIDPELSLEIRSGVLRFCLHLSLRLSGIFGLILQFFGILYRFLSLAVRYMLVCPHYSSPSVSLNALLRFCVRYSITDVTSSYFIRVGPTTPSLPTQVPSTQ